MRFSVRVGLYKVKRSQWHRFDELDIGVIQQIFAPNGLLDNFNRGNRQQADIDNKRQVFNY